MRLSIIFLASFLAGNALMAQEVRKVYVGDNQHAGITYTLPQTVVRVQATAVCTRVKAGEFAPYAEKYLGITDAVLDDRTDWQITGVTLTPAAAPDTSRTFHIQFNEKQPMPTFYLTKEGSLWSINCEPNVTKKSQPEAAAEESADEASKKNNLRPINVMTEELLRAGSKAKQAEIAARAIFRIRESRLNLLTGEVDNLPADGASFQLVLDNLEAQEAAYMELFTGKTTVETCTREFEFLPVQETKNHVLFRFSHHYGFVDADDLSGEPYQLSVSITHDNRQVPELTDAKGRKLPVATGVAYIQPGKASIRLTSQGATLGSGEWPMAQFGHVEFLPSTHFAHKNAPVSALFDPLTGSMQLYQVK
ncbi:MAG: DUF4831 family protein [Bacteroidales bacterium]|nr:DUF4831 family protein [Bacteroidales bacterium]